MKHPFRRLEIILLVILGLQLALLIISLPGQRIQGDEAVFAEFAYFQAETGHPRSELFRGFLDYDNRILIYHKFFQWMGASVVKLFGFGAWPLRSLSLIAGLILFSLLYRHMNRDESLGGRTGFLAAAAFLVLAPLTFKFFKFYRPEVMLAVMGLGSFMALNCVLRQGRARWAVIAGALVERRTRAGQSHPSTQSPCGGKRAAATAWSVIAVPPSSPCGCVPLVIHVSVAQHADP